MQCAYRYSVYLYCIYILCAYIYVYVGVRVRRMVGVSKSSYVALVGGRSGAGQRGSGSARACAPLTSSAPNALQLRVTHSRLWPALRSTQAVVARAHLVLEKSQNRLSRPVLVLL